MTFISTPKIKTKHQQTPQDVYYSNLEEAYGNLPVPADDYASIKHHLKKVLPENEREEDEHAATTGGRRR